MTRGRNLKQGSVGSVGSAESCTREVGETKRRPEEEL